MPELSGVLAYGETGKDAIAKVQVQAFALRVVADRIEHGEVPPDIVDIRVAAESHHGHQLLP